MNIYERVAISEGTDNTGGDNSKKKDISWGKRGAALGAAAGIYIGHKHIGPWAGGKVAKIRDKFDKDLQTSKKRIAKAENEVKQAKKYAKETGDDEYNKLVSRAESRLASAKKEAEPHMARSQKRAEKYRKVGSIVGIPAGVAYGAGTLGGVGFLADFTREFSRDVEDEHNKRAAN